LKVNQQASRFRGDVQMQDDTLFGSLDGRVFERALFLAHCSTVAYEDNPASFAKSRGIKLDDFCPIEDENSDTRGFIACCGKNVVVAIGGTSSFRNLTTDVDLAFSKACRGNVHRGFEKAAQGVIGIVAQELKNKVKEPGRVWLTGHSLGGAVALLIAKHLVTGENGLPDPCKPHEVVTFGAPMVGDLGFAKRCPLRDRVIPIANLNDPIPYMPPILGWDYKHVDGAYHYRLSEQGWKKVNLRGSMSKTFVERLRADWYKLRKLLSNGIATHQLSRYVEYLRKILGESPGA